MFPSNQSKFRARARAKESRARWDRMTMKSTRRVMGHSLLYLLTALIHLLAPHCLLRVRPPLRSFARSLTHSGAYGKEVRVWVQVRVRVWVRSVSGNCMLGFHIVSTHSKSLRFALICSFAHSLAAELLSQINVSVKELKEAVPVQIQRGLHSSNSFLLL